MNINIINTQVLIIGGGYAGLTTKLFLSQANIHSTVLDIQNNRVDFSIVNYPGIKRISHKSLINKIKLQIKEYDKSFQIDTYTKNVIDIKEHNNAFITNIQNQKYMSKYIVLTHGVKIKNVLQKVSDSIQQRVIYNIEEIDLVNINSVTIIGGGDRCAQICAHLIENNIQNINIIIRTGIMKTLNKIVYNSCITIYKFTQIIDINIHNKNEMCIHIKNRIDNKYCFIYTNYIVIAAGSTYDKIVCGIDIYNNDGSICVRNNNETHIKNIYAGGSAIQKHCQIINACHHGSVIAIDIANKELVGHIFKY